MPTIRLTKRTIDALPAIAAGQILYRDSELTGFGLRVGAKAKTFFAESQVRRRNVRVSLGRYPLMTPEVARREALKVLSEMAEGRNPQQQQKRFKSITVRAAFDMFFAAKANLSEHTLDHYARSCDLYLKSWQQLPLQEISKQMILAMHQRISAERGAITANNVFRHLRSVYNFIAVTQEEFPPNPVLILSQARAWVPERRRRSIISAHQMPTWWRAVMEEDSNGRDLLCLALFTGMRRGEVCSLRWEQIDLPARRIHIPTTKNGDPLLLPLPDFLVRLLSARRAAHPSEDWVFPSSGASGHVLEPKPLIRRVEARSGVPFMLHDLRRTFITIAESLDIPAYALKALLNHRSTGDVTGGYIIMDVERLRGPIERVADRIISLAGSTSAISDDRLIDATALADRTALRE